MERPAKRMKITDPDARNPRHSGSRMKEGLFTSEMDRQSDDTDDHVQPTRTISLSDFRRQRVFGSYHIAPRPVLPRRNAGIYLFPRAPDATVTANVVEVNVNEGTSTSIVTEVPAAVTGAVVSLTDVGALTTALSITIPGASNSTTVVGSATDSSQQTITSPATDSSQQTITSPLTTSVPPDETSTVAISSPLPTFSEMSNSTTSLPTTSTEPTVTVTATSTFELSLINGTIIATEPQLGTATKTSSSRIIETSSSASKTYTFGDLTSSSTDSSKSFTKSYSSGSTTTSSGRFIGGTGAGAAGSPTLTSNPSATSSKSPSSGGGGGGTSAGLTPVQQQVVGGVVGGVAGVAITLVIVLYVLRCYRRRLKARGQLPEQIAARELAGGAVGDAYPMSQGSSTVPLATALVQGLRHFRSHSNHTVGPPATDNTDASLPERERGFQRIAGRKLAPVLSNGGDPYGGDYGAFEKDSGVGPSTVPSISETGLSGATFYRDSRGFYGGRGAQTPTTPSSPTTATTGTQLGSNIATAGTTSSVRDFAEPPVTSRRSSSQASLATPSRPEGYAVMRPSPARTPRDPQSRCKLDSTADSATSGTRRASASSAFDICS